LNQKFFGKRAETNSKLPLPQSRVFSKNFLRQLPDGTTQVQKVASNLKQAEAPKKEEASMDNPTP
jgi:hypothetical protein